MSKHVKISKGLDIKLKGVADKVYGTFSSETYALKPTDFPGLTPKLTVKVGDEVKAGTPIFYDKYNEKVKFVAPVSGEVVAVNRGEKRRILEVVILADKEIKYESYAPKSGTREEVIDSICEAGLWPLFKQRPYDVVPDPQVTPKAIHISAFNSAPLAADLDFCLHGREQEFQAGLNVLSKLSDGKVHLNVHSSKTTSDVFKGANGVEKNTISGPHPSGLAGIQINNIDPVNKGETVWTINPQSVAIIGKFFNEKKVDLSVVIAMAGSMVAKPKYYKTHMGVSVKGLIKDNLNPGNTRIISGDVLSGERVYEEGYLGFYHNTLSIIPEGGDSPFMGWLTPNLHKLSVSRTFFSWLTPGKEYDLNTNQNGEERPFVVSGQYEKVFPMDIYPVQLLKSIIINDIEAMENLGIYEIAPEDFGLCEFVCSSKISLQDIVRKGLDTAQKELG